jgi:hypothetical protein
MLSVLLCCLWLFSSRPLAPFLAVLTLLHCHTSLPIDAHRVPSCNPGQRPPHDVIVDVEVDQHAADFVWHVLHRIEAMRMWSTIAADNNAESNGVNDWSPLELHKSLSSHS